MTVMASGSDAAFARLAPVLDAVAGKVYRIGSDIGLGSTVKLSISCWPGAHRRCRRSDGACRPRRSHWRRCMTWSPTRRVIPRMFENRMQHVPDGDYSPKSAVDIFVKDPGW